jgi:predicted nucleic acid-binding protein
MRFWDASAVVALIVDEPGHKESQTLMSEDPVMLVWWTTPVECVSALCRRERDGSLDSRQLRTASQRLHALADEWHEVMPTTALRSVAERMLRVHPLRAADALQLAAAVAAAEHEPESLPFVSLDDRLNDAAAKEGFPIVQPR